MDWAVWGLCTLAAVVLAAPTEPTAPAAPQKIIIDTDFNTIGDDGQVLAMAAQLHKSKALEILGLTTVTGNQWLAQGVSDGLKAVERLGIEKDVGIYIGANEPLLHTYAAHQLEAKRFGNGTLYVGAYGSPPPGPEAKLVAPPDGFATHTTPRPQGAVQFILDTVHRYPHEVTILAIGPLTNLALALRLDPSIAPLIKGIYHMGGQLYAAGNSYNGAGETNWWMDPEAARVVLRAPVPKMLYPLDLTNTVRISNETYDAIGNHEPATAITTLMRGIQHWAYAYDAIALASLVDPSLNREVRELYVDISCNADDESYGKGLAWTEDPYPGTGLATAASVVFSIDNDRFFETYVDLLMRPILPSQT